jgi:hypothetical protein
LYLKALQDKRKYHTKSDLTNAEVITHVQKEKLGAAVNEVKRTCKYISIQTLQTTNILTTFMEKLCIKPPTWDPHRVGDSLVEVAKWQNKVLPLSKYILHAVTTNRLEMARNVRAGLEGKWIVEMRM